MGLCSPTSALPNKALPAGLTLTDSSRFYHAMTASVMCPSGSAPPDGNGYSAGKRRKIQPAGMAKRLRFHRLGGLGAAMQITALLVDLVKLVKGRFAWKWFALFSGSCLPQPWCPAQKGAHPNCNPCSPASPNSFIGIHTPPPQASVAVLILHQVGPSQKKLPYKPVGHAQYPRRPVRLGNLSNMCVGILQCLA